jgi:hypothetical protein
MAALFSLCAECYDDEGEERFKAHFEGLKHVLRSGRIVSWYAYGEEESGYPRVVLVISFDLPRFGGSTLQDCLDTTEAGIHLLQHLLTAPDFRFAEMLVHDYGQTVDDLRSYIQDFEGEKWLAWECVVDEATWKQLGSPKYFAHFRPGYLWNGWRGERYMPMQSSDHPEIKQLYREVLPPDWNDKNR